MVNHYIAGREFLEQMRKGAFAEGLAYCLEREGVVHFSPDCLLMGVPCEDAPDTLWIIFQHSHLPALRRVLLSLPYKRVRWQRDWGHSKETLAGKLLGGASVFVSLGSKAMPASVVLEMTKRRSFSAASDRYAAKSR